MLCVIDEFERRAGGYVLPYQVVTGPLKFEGKQTG